MDIIVSGVGGQGVILLSRALAEAALSKGLGVNISETIGMAQREGTVVSHIRLGSPYQGSLIPDGGADVIIGLELAEAARSLPKLKAAGTVIANQAQVVPVTVGLGISQYPVEDIVRYLKQQVKNLFLFNANRLAVEAGHYKAVNMVMLGACSVLPSLPYGGEIMRDIALQLLPHSLREINRRAFELGRRAMEERAWNI